MGDVYRVTVKIPREDTTIYVVGEKEKNFLMGVFKEYAVAEVIEIETRIENADTSD